MRQPPAAGRTPAASAGSSPALHERRLAAPDGPTTASSEALGEPGDELGDQALAPEEVGGVVGLEGCQPLVRARPRVGAVAVGRLPGRRVRALARRCSSTCWMPSTLWAISARSPASRAADGRRAVGGRADVAARPLSRPTRWPARGLARARRPSARGAGRCRRATTRRRRTSRTPAAPRRGRDRAARGGRRRRPASAATGSAAVGVGPERRDDEQRPGDRTTRPDRRAPRWCRCRRDGRRRSTSSTGRPPNPVASTCITARPSSATGSSVERRRPASSSERRRAGRGSRCRRRPQRPYSTTPPVRCTSRPSSAQQACLADALRAEHRDEATAPIDGVEPRRAQPGQLGVASDERRARPTRAAPAARTGAGSPPVQVQARVLIEDRGFELAQLATGLDAQLLGQRRSGPPVGAERVALPPRAVQREHQLRPQPLPELVPRRPALRARPPAPRSHPRPARRPSGPRSRRGAARPAGGPRPRTPRSPGTHRTRRPATAPARDAASPDRPDPRRIAWRRPRRASSSNHSESSCSSSTRSR